MTCGASHGFIVVLIFILYELVPFSRNKYTIFSTVNKYDTITKDITLNLLTGSSGSHLGKFAFISTHQRQLTTT